MAFKVQYRDINTGKMVTVPGLKTRTATWKVVLRAKDQGADASTLELRVREHQGSTWADVTGQF